MNGPMRTYTCYSRVNSAIDVNKLIVMQIALEVSIVIIS